jgi:DNA modification methylase
MMRTTTAESREARQLELPGIELEANLEAPAGNSSGFRDPAFSGNKTQPIHRWVPWIAGFSGEFVRQAITKYLSRHNTVLDPFCGVGTTLVEAVELGHNAVGFEINPYAAFASRVKANCSKIDVEHLLEQMLRFRAFYSEKVSSDYAPISASPPGFRTRAEFYSPKVLRKVLTLLDFVSSIQDVGIRDLFRLAFASTMVRYSNYSYEPSLGRRVSAGKSDIEDYPVGQTVLSKLEDMAEDIVWFQRNLRNGQPNVRVIQASFFDHERHVEPDSADLVVTSPPYLNNYHYNRNTRPHLYWLGYAKGPQDLKPLEQSNFGKFWQTVRSLECIGLTFSLPGTDLTERLEVLRHLKPERGVYGGGGWANYAASYFNDCHRFALGLQRVMKPKGTALVVIGNSILQGVSIPTDEYFGRIAESVGLELMGIEIPRATRVGNSIIQSDVRVVKAKDAHRLYEAIVELRKR